LGVPGCQKLGDAALKIANALEGRSADGLLVKIRKPAIDRVEPARTGGNEVQHEPGMPLEQALYPGATVRAVVIEDEVQGFPARTLGFEPPQKLQELLMAVPRTALADDPAFAHVQRGEERGGAVTLGICV